MSSDRPLATRASLRALFLGAVLAMSAALALPALAQLGARGAPPGPPPPADLEACRMADDAAQRAHYDDWAATLLDTARSLDTDYVPPDLVDAELGAGSVRLRSFVVPELTALLAAAAADDVSITVTSGYRSYRGQARTLRSAIRASGEAAAMEAVARPGHSEHQLGTTVDLAGGAGWLAENAWHFGFVMSYPPGRSPGATCYRPEPWHYRYFGRERAAAIRESGLSPREWLWLDQQRG